VADVDPQTIAVGFNDCINSRDIEGLASLMSDDHRFVDADGAVISGKANCVAAWRGFFEAFPDYRNVFASMVIRDDVVIIVGYSECAEPSLAGPAVWTATIREGAVVEWRVYEDTSDIRDRLGVR
jgi:ketosteroid isomerase-like protein